MSFSGFALVKSSTYLKSDNKLCQSIMLRRFVYLSTESRIKLTEILRQLSFSFSQLKAIELGRKTESDNHRVIVKQFYVKNNRFGPDSVI